MPAAPKLPFFCELCGKGYARVSELEAHESSYDHHHRKRAADLRRANRSGGRRVRDSERGGAMRPITEAELSKLKSKRVKADLKSIAREAGSREQAGTVMDAAAGLTASRDTDDSSGTVKDAVS